MPKSTQIVKTMGIKKTNSDLNILAKLDGKDYLILNELLKNPDVTSADIAKKFKIPLSTVQRRRTALEHSSMIKKSYELDARQFGWRTADILIAVGRGGCIEIANRLLTENIGIRLSSDISKKINGSDGPRVIETSLRIGDPEVNVVARVIYRTSDELLHIIQEIKKMSNIARVEWSEIVKVVGRNDTVILTQ